MPRFGTPYRKRRIKAKDRASYQHTYYMRVTKPRRRRERRRKS